MIGVLLNSCFDIRFSATGIMFASLGVLVTSLYQIVSIYVALGSEIGPLLPQ